MPNRLHAVIAGAGIGGLAAAIALSRAGLRVNVLERAPVVEEAGAGLQLAPNATGLLRELGILDRVMKFALTPESLRIRRARDGQELARLPLGPIAEFRWGAPSVVIHRADLQRVLFECCAADSAITVETGMTVAGFASSASGVEVAVKPTDGENRRIAADILIGADGLRSTVRARIGLGTTDEPVWSGRIAWRALVPAAQAPDAARKLETGLWLGSRAHLVHYPLRDGSLINIVAITEDGWRGDEAPDLWAVTGEARDVSARFARWHPDARALVAAATSWKRWPLFDRNPVRRWTLDRVALLGDAAHPMLPFFAQGAAQAIEDAAALGRAFRRVADARAALTAYETMRTARAGAVVIASRRQGAIYHMGGLTALARDLTMRGLGAHRMMSRLDWLYNFKPEA
jgi:salicylate hydroxylase